MNASAMIGSQIRAKAHIGRTEKKQSGAKGKKNNIKHGNFL